MMAPSSPSLAAARQAFYGRNGLSAARDSGAAWWACRLGPLVLRFPNFRWRRAAIQHHDLHHVLTGYACNVRGELEMAAWEFAAGRFPHRGATLFCLPLVAAGAVLAPRRSFAAFARGRRSRSLYGEVLNEALLATPLEELRRRTLPVGSTAGTARDRIAWVGLVAQSLALCLSPGLLLAPFLLG